MNKRILMLTSIFLLFLIPVMAITNIHGEISKEQGIEEAKKYLEQKGLRTQGKPEARKNQDKYFGANIWDVSFDNKIFVGINADTGEVVRYLNLNSIGGEGNIDPGTAKAKAESFIKPPLDAVLSEVKPGLIVNNEVEQYAVIWRRNFSGYLSEELYGDLIEVQVNARNGKVILSRKMWTQKTPASFDVRISKEDAITRATESLNDRLPSEIEISHVELQIIRPNHYWSGEEVLSSDSKLAWTVRFGQERFMEVWIDAVTGENLGGYKTV